MIKLAIDTNAYRALRDANPKVSSLLKDSAALGMPIIVLGELYYGIERGTKKEENTRNLSHFISSSSVQILHITSETARIFGEISAELSLLGRPIQQNDIWIASLCKQYGFTLISADKGFGHVRGLDTISF